MRDTFALLAVLVALLVITGCNNLETSPKDTVVSEEKLVNETLVCEPPLILVPTGTACCEDYNNNEICDMVESTIIVSVLEAEPNLYDVPVVCKKSFIDGYVACPIGWLPEIALDNPTDKLLKISVGFSGWDNTSMKVPQLDFRAETITGLDGQEVFGYHSNISAGTALPILLSADVFDWHEELSDQEVFVRLCTQFEESPEVNCQNTTYTIAIGLT